MTLPNFIYIGTSRAGSTWLYQALDEHPQVFVPAAKDIFFFDRLYEKGIAWYEGNFPADAAHYPAIGEVSHDYFQSAVYLERIRQHVPHARLIACLREPGTQSLSAYQWWHTHGKFPGSYEEFTHAPLCLSAIDYYQNLQNVYALFPREQILVVFYEELRQDPQTFIERIYRYIGVDDGFAPSILRQRVNARNDARYPALTQFAYRAGQLVRRWGLGGWVGKVKTSPFMQRLLYTPAAPKPQEDNNQAAVAALRARCQAWYPALEELLQRPLPPSWK